ncbi:putative Transferase hexapeptide (Six repeat-containing protein) [Alteromonas sp. 38]|uniref:acyltransferase n=1 Tax=Alteromonas TaxID=226 RepID=UPI0012EF3C63|nr:MULTISPECIES: hypothetical protein [Alteromonas]CAD5250201.1 putative Transferase hexapeptide (Six repeat-containing protein) [Alteromonas sp. 154]VXC39171.1 putative Transferase hexapeptide (Six repeat-containing protein) [Alteromonas sp. 38]
MKLIGRVDENTIKLETEESDLPGLNINFIGQGNKLVIGRNFKCSRLDINFFKDNCTLFIGQNVVLAGSLNFKGKNTQMSIGSGTKCNASLFANLGEDNDKISIGENCLFAQVKFRTSDSHKIMDIETGARINRSKDIVLEDRVWIAEDTLVKGGAHIGSGTVVGAKSFVSKELKQNCIYAGAPVRLIRENIRWEE